MEVFPPEIIKLDSSLSDAQDGMRLRLLYARLIMITQRVEQEPDLSIPELERAWSRLLVIADALHAKYIHSVDHNQNLVAQQCIKIARICRIRVFMLGHV